MKVKEWYLQLDDDAIAETVGTVAALIEQLKLLQPDTKVLAISVADETGSARLEAPKPKKRKARKA